MAAAILPGVRLGARDGGAEGGLREKALRTLVSPRVHRDGDEECGGEGGGEEQQGQGPLGRAGEVEGGDECQIRRRLHKGQSMQSKVCRHLHVKSFVAIVVDPIFPIG